MSNNIPQLSGEGNGTYSQSLKPGMLKVNEQGFERVKEIDYLGSTLRGSVGVKSLCCKPEGCGSRPDDLNDF
jgi:hypothetical protein